jgi:hypothetical protein
MSLINIVLFKNLFIAQLTILYYNSFKVLEQPAILKYLTNIHQILRLCRLLTKNLHLEVFL